VNAIATQPTEGVCARCEQPRVVFPAKPEWGRVPTPLCTTDWSLFADARAGGTFVDWNDAFDNASDDQIETHLAGGS
jgi:hypothetical protein